MEQDPIQNVKDIATAIGVYYKSLRQQGVGRHLSAELTVMLAVKMLDAVFNGGKQ